MDAKFDRIQEIKVRDNADTLEIAIVSNFPCVVRKGEFNVGDWVFYIRDDAKLLGYDELKAREKRDREAMADGSLVTQDCFTCTWQWQDSLLKYLGSNGRVRSIKLRGKISMGILLKPRDVLLGQDISDETAARYNEMIMDPDNGANFLEKNFGVTHWVAPIVGSMGQTDARGPLIRGLQKTDEENFQNIPDELFPWNSTVLLTKKLDGTSCSISSTKDGDVHVMSRSLDLKLECDNVYNRAAAPIIPIVKKLAEHYGETVVLRGEVTGDGINSSKVNLDCHGPATFNLFAVVFPDSQDESKRVGLYGTPWHFTEVAKVCKEITGYDIKTVPIEGEAVLTRELLEQISDRPKKDGEGRVINTKYLMLPHFKSKSKDYLLGVG